MKLVWLTLAALVGASATAAALNTEVRVGQDDAAAGVAYLRYYPPTVVVVEGDTVTWKADSVTPHTVTQFPEQAGNFDSSPALDHNSPTFQAWFGPGGFLLGGQSFNRTFDRPGTFPYFCKIHPGMEGTITVVNATTASQGSSGIPGLPGSEGQNRSAAPDQPVRITAGWGSGETTVDRFSPAHVTIAVGTNVVWTNLHSSEPHTSTGVRNPQAPPSPDNVVWDSSPNVGPPPAGWFDGPRGTMSTSETPNTQFTHTFTKAGTYTYFCKLHPPMWGTVIVLEKPAPPATGGTGGTTNAGASGGSPSGSRVPGPALPLLLGAIAVAVVLARRREGPPEA